LKEWRVIGSKAGVQGWDWSGKGEIFRKEVQKKIKENSKLARAL